MEKIHENACLHVNYMKAKTCTFSFNFSILVPTFTPHYIIMVLKDIVSPVPPPLQLYSLLSFVAPRVFPLAKQDKFVAEFSDVKGQARPTNSSSITEEDPLSLSAQ